MMSTNMSSTSLNLEAQLLSIMDVLARAAVTEITQLFSESSVSLRLQISQSLKENEALRTRMKVMRSELFALRLQTRTSGGASRPASRFPLGVKTNTPRPRIKPLVLVKSPVPQKAVGDDAPASVPTEKETMTVDSQEECQSADVETPDVILIKDEEDIGGCRSASAGQEDFGNHDTQGGGGGGGGVATASPDMEAPGSSHMTEEEKYMHQEEELQIISVHGRGEGPLLEENDTLFSASELQALSCLSPDHSINHDSLLGFHSGGAGRPLIRALQDISGMRDGTQMATLMKAAMKTTLGADGKGGHPSHISQLRQQQQQQQQQQPSPILAHTINKSMDCSFCGERFPSREELIVHRATHTGESPIPCGLCGKPFVNKTTLAIHMRIHTGEKPYVCPQCGKRFTQNGSLKIHLRTHSGEKPYTCSRCTASFNNPSNLRRHMIIHTTNGVL